MLKVKVFTFLIFAFCLGELFSQELRMMPRDIDIVETNSYLMDFEAENSEEHNSISLIKLGSELYSLQFANLEIGVMSLGINSRLEEVLPYENANYDFAGFYYIDLGVSYIVNNFSMGLSIDNFFNLDNKNFSIDPIVEQSNGIINNYYFSYETDASISMTLTYDF